MCSKLPTELRANTGTHRSPFQQLLRVAIYLYFHCMFDINISKLIASNSFLFLFRIRMFLIGKAHCSNTKWTCMTFLMHPHRNLKIALACPEQIATLNKRSSHKNLFGGGVGSDEKLSSGSKLKILDLRPILASLNIFIDLLLVTQKFEALPAQPSIFWVMIMLQYFSLKNLGTLFGKIYIFNNIFTSCYFFRDPHFLVSHIPRHQQAIANAA